jgi:ABC-type spermidine/putrescine transport system permease subunit I
VTRVAIQVPLVSPRVIVAFAAILLFGRRGVVTKAILEDALGLIRVVPCGNDRDAGRRDEAMATGKGDQA